MKNIKYVEVSGSPYERGFQQGLSLKNRINENIIFYKDLIKLSDGEFESQAKHFKSIISNFDSDYIVEIEAIAEGAEINSTWIYMLNARSELFNNTKECTSFFFKETSILAQNWDWAKTSEELITVIKSTDELGNSFVHLTEAGIIGKIGMNDRGVGTCLNILFSNNKVTGVPVHILLRSALDSKDLQSAKERILRYGNDTVGNLLLGSFNGVCTDLELNGEQIYEYTTTEPILFHVNHFQAKKNMDREASENSKARFHNMRTITRRTQSYGIEDAKKILANRGEGESAICRSFKEHSILKTHGTIVSIIMDLKRLELHITDGNPAENDYMTFPLD